KAKRDKSEERKPIELEDPRNMTNDASNARRNEPKNAQRTKGTRPMPSGVPSLISADMVIRGEIHAEGEVQFDGEIDGDIHAKGLVIGEGATVRGEVVAEKVRVAGVVDGRIRATRVELTASAIVRGDVLHTALMIEAGARFEGSCRHSDDPMSGQAAPIQQPRELPHPSQQMKASAPQREQMPMRREMAMNEGAPRSEAPAGDMPPSPPRPQPTQPKAALGGKTNLR
ncbi:MAG: polymer-forming cytoskeletal protein, partial [Parvularcula sp.]|nr:polymer-forming cytoskeletal protein [Parvularcula sp.]